MLDATLRMAAAAAVAIGLGLMARTRLLLWLPDMKLVTIFLIHATLLCVFGTSASISSWSRIEKRPPPDRLSSPVKYC